MRAGFKKKQLSVLILLALMPGSLVYGACTPAGTASDDTITCDGAVDTQGVNAGAGNDSVTVSAAAGTIRINATGTQTGVDAGDDADTVINWWMISAGSTTTQTQSPTPPSPTIGGLPVTQHNVVSASTTGITGGSGNDTIVNNRDVSSNAAATGQSVSVPLTLAGGDVVTATTAIEAQAIGLAGGAGQDSVTNTLNGYLDVGAQARTNAINTELNFTDTTHGKADTTITSTAVAIDGNGSLENRGDITSYAESRSDSVNVEINLIDAAMADASLTVDSYASGIRTGAEQSAITNAGSIVAYSSSRVSDVAVNASYLDITIADRKMGSAGTTLNATSAGIDGALGLAIQSITNTNALDVQASSNAHSTGVSLASEGVPAATEPLLTGLADELGIASIGIQANSMASGIIAGIGNDTITNTSGINANADATATQESINVGIALVDYKIPTPGIVLGSAGTGALADVFGIDGGIGNDTITNSGLLTVGSSADASAVTVSANIAEFSANPFGGGSIPVLGNLGFSLVVADTVTAATANATGIQGGAGNDQITSSNTVNVNADADGGSVSASASLNIKYKEGDNFFSANAVGARAETAVEANALALGGGDGNDAITNNGTLNANALSDAHTVSASLVVAGSLKGNGGSLSLAATDTSSESTANATGIQGNAGDDQLSNAGTINATSDADALAVSASLTVGIAKQGAVIDAALARSESNATASSIGMDSGEGHDRLQNTGTINSTADADAMAVSVAVSVSGTNKGLAIGAAMTDASTTADSTVIGMKGGADAGVADSDLTVANISNTGSIAVDADAETTSVGVSLSVSLAKEGVALGGALADSSTHATANATGIEGGIGDDRILNTGSISVVGEADALAVSASVSVSGTTSGFAAGAALSDASATVNVAGVGIDGGAGNDLVHNQNLIDVHNLDASATSVGVSVAGSFAESGLSIGAALARSGTEATAAGTGIFGNAGNDNLINESNVRLRQISADADAVTVSLGLSGSQTGLSVAVGLADANGEANAVAVGMDGGIGNDALNNTSSILAEDIESQAFAASISVALSGASNGVAAGLTIADTSATARSTAKGLDGGASDDTLTNSNSIVLQRVTSEADAISVGVSVGAAITAGVAAAGALARADANAGSLAVGLDGNDGNDTVTNTGSITVRDIGAESDAIGISASIGVTNAGVALSAAVADTTSTATSTARGIAGGAGNDDITNQGAILLRNIDADASATSVSVNLNAAIQGGVAAGVSLTDASSHANVNATGIDGGDGNDVLRNTSTITAASGIESDAHATGVSVAMNVSFAGVAAGASISDTSAHAATTVRGMDGGIGDDTLYNDNTISLTGRSEADGLSVAVSVSATLGIAAGLEITDASTNAETTVTGMEGGAGRDDIRNDSTLSVNSFATAEASSISVGVSVGLGGDMAWADSQATANATAIGIGDSAGTDIASIVDNRGSITAQSTSSTEGLSVAASLFGLGLGEIGNTSNASSYGVRTGDGVDHVSNTGAITANANASTTGLAIAANFGGVVHGDASTTANALATGIATGAGADVVTNTAALDIDATSSADVLSVSATLAGTARNDVKTQSLTTATGIDGGDGNDQLSSNANLAVNATSTTSALSVQVSVFGTAGSDVMNTPTASVAAISAGGGDDTATLAGTVRVESLATADITSSSWSLGGSVGSRAGVEASASAIGLDGGSGADLLINRSTSLLVFGTSRAIANSTSWEFAGTAGAESVLAANSRVAGLDGGDGDDHLRNEAAFRATANAQLQTTGGANAIFGNASTNTDIGATSVASGLVGGTGNDLIENLARIDVSAVSIVNSTRTSFSFAGSPDINELLKAKSTSIGLDGGAGNDVIYNDGRLFVDAYASAITNGSSETMLGGSTRASGKAVAEAITIGLAGGDGDDQIENRNAINADTRLFPQTNNSSSAGVFFGSGTVEGHIKGTLSGSAIDGGNGNNRIYNYGQLFVRPSTLSTASANTYASGSDFSFFTGGSGNGFSRMELDVNSVGIRAGNGNNTVLNASTGMVFVSMPDVVAQAYTDPNGGSTSGSGNGTSEAVIKAVGAGIWLGDGTNVVQNDGGISVVVNPIATATSDVDGTGLDNGNAWVRPTTEIDAIGIRTGNGDYHVVSNGSIGVTAVPFAQSFTDVYGGDPGGDGNGYVDNRSTGNAYGIVAGNGNGYIENNGVMSISATPYAQAVNGTTNIWSTGHGDGDAVGNVDSTSTALAIGIKTGTGTQTIINSSAITVDASAHARGGYSLNIDDDFINSHAYATVNLFAKGNAIGIQVGGGNATVLNSGDLTVTAKPSTAVTYSTGDGGPYIVRERVGQAVGIELGNGGGAATQSVVNDGNITVEATGEITGHNDCCNFDPGSVRKGGAPTAIGVQVKNTGQTEIVNNGTISVNAQALYTPYPTLGVVFLGYEAYVKATAIDATVGTNTVVNNGTLSALYLLSDNLFGFMQNSYAVRFGAGDDTLSLGASSVTTGNVDFGTGNSTLVLTGTPQLNGNITNDTSRDFRLVLNDSGSFGHVLPTVTHATKNGLGTYTLPDLNSVQRLTVNQGTLSVLNDYRFSNTGEFQTSVYRDGTNGRLMSGNIVTLGGTLNVQRETGAYRDGVSFDVVLADSIAAGSNFSNIVLPEPTTLVTFHSQQLADRVRITTDVESFTTLAANAEQQGIAAGLDLLMSDTSESTNQLLGQAQNLNSTQATVALTTLGPGIYNFHNLAAFSNAHQSANLLQERMRGQHTAELMSGPTIVAKQEPIRLAYDGDNLGQLLDAGEAERERSQGVWLRGFSQRGDQEADDNQLNGFRYNLNGFTFGYDQRVSSTFTLGASIGSVKNHLENDAGLSDGHVKTGLLSFYGGYFDKEFYANGVLAYGKNRYDTERNIIVGASTVPVSSEHDGRVFAATLSGGYYGKVGESFWIGPYASLQYTRLKEEAFTETGSVVALNVQGRATSALISTLGIRAAAALAAGSGSFIPELSVAWVHDYKIDDQLLTASYVGAPDATFTVDGRSVDRTGVLTGVGIGYRTHDGFTSSLKYTGEFRDGLHVHGLIGELRYEF